MSSFIRQPWIGAAMGLLGTKEVPGSKNNDVILRWAKDIGGWVADYYKEDSIPWCGLFVAHCFNVVGIKPPSTLLTALRWNEWGVKLDEPAFGCVMVFKRDGGGHVGYYMSEDDEAFHILGGNQTDMVNIARVAKANFVGCRWPEGMDHLLIKGRISATLKGSVAKSSDLA